MDTLVDSKIALDFMFGDASKRNQAESDTFGQQYHPLTGVAVLLFDFPWEADSS